MRARFLFDKMCGLTCKNLIDVFSSHLLASWDVFFLGISCSSRFDLFITFLQFIVMGRVYY
jgi:hypothetical protein